MSTSRVNPWSVLKMSFLLAVGIGIAVVGLIAGGVDRLVGDRNLYRSKQRYRHRTSGSAATFNLLDYLGFGKVASTSIVIAVVDLLLISAIAILYNACSSLVGGLHPSLPDDE